MSDRPRRMIDAEPLAKLHRVTTAEPLAKLHRVTTDDGFVYRFTESDTVCLAADIPEALLADQLQVVRDFLSCHPDFVYFFDPDHRFVYASPPLLRLWGRSLDEVVGKGFEELGYPRDLVDLRRTQLDLAFAGKTVRGENPYTAADGSTRYYEYIFVPLHLEGREITRVAGITRDVTRRKRLEEERELLLATLAHDLRNPLGVLLAGAEILAETASDPTARKLAERMSRNAQRADRLVENLLDAAEAGAGPSPDLRRERLHLDRVVVEAAEQMELLYHGSVEVEVEGDADRYDGLWDDDAVRRIVENVVGNALKHGDPKRPVTVRLERDEDDVVLTVHNWGEPIPTEQQDSLFDLFARAAGVEDRRGWGIGLTVVSSLVDRHGGEVSVASSAEEGTTFTVRLPVVQRP